MSAVYGGVRTVCSGVRVACNRAQAGWGGVRGGARGAKAVCAVSLLLVFGFSTTGCGVTGPQEVGSGGPEPGDLRVLFIGSSYLSVNDLPGLFAGLSEAAGKEIFVAYRVQPGYYLDFFAQDQATTHAIQSRKWDYVILSGGCQTAAYPNTHHLIKASWGHHDPYPALKTIKEKVSKNHPETVLIYMMPWAFEDGMTWIPGQTDDYFAMQENIRRNALAWSESLDLVVAPVGTAWETILKQGVQEHYLHQGDWNHPSPRGSFLSAATLFATVFKESGEGVGFRWILSQEEADAFLKVGAEAVLGSPPATSSAHSERRASTGSTLEALRAGT